MTPGKTEAKAVAKAMDPGFGDLDKEQQQELIAIAMEVTKVAWEQYETKARFMVMGQVRYRDGWLSPDDVRAARVALGPFSTRKMAEQAGDSLAYHAATGEESRWAAVPFWHGTPAAWYQARLKERQQAAQAVSDTTPARELRHQHIRDWLDAHPGATVLPEHLQGNGWEGLDRYMEWRSGHALQCPSCEGTGKIRQE